MIILYAVPISLWPMLGKENQYFLAYLMDVFVLVIIGTLTIMTVGKYDLMYIYCSLSWREIFKDFIKMKIKKTKIYLLNHKDTM